MDYRYYQNALVYAILSALALSFTCYGVNYFVYHYPGNDYLPKHYIAGLAVVGLTYLGAKIYFGPKHKFTDCTWHLCLFYVVIICIGLLTNSIQYTPFPTVDQYIIALEHYFNVNLVQLMQFLEKKPLTRHFLTIIYDSLSHQIILLPLLAIVLSYFYPKPFKERLYQFYLLILWTAFFGFSVYYFLPTTAPASNLISEWFTPSQYDTGLKFMQLHRYISPTTMDGGMIALPSFHTVWAILCLYLIYPLKGIFYPLLLINIILIAACVLLGWHYPTDIIAAFVLLGGCYLLILFQLKSAAMKYSLA